MNKPFLLLAIGLMLTACSVKEDRGPCPCLLSVIPAEAFAPLDDDPTRPWKLTLRGYAESGTIVDESFGAERAQDTLEYPVRKGSVVVAAWLMEAETRVEAECYRIPYGEQAQPLFACREAVDASGETVCCILHPHKQFSRILIFDEGDREKPFGGREATVSGTVCGMDLQRLIPLAGDFRCAGEPANTEQGRGFLFRIPRQRTDDLLLDLGSGLTAWTGLPLGELLFAAGYDPEAEDCLDYAVYIDSSRLQSGVSIIPWEVIPLDITI